MGTLTYLDASVLAALFVSEAASTEARRMLGLVEPLTSRLSMAEVSSAIARRARMGEIAIDDASARFQAFDEWIHEKMVLIELLPDDFAVATQYVRRMTLGLRTPDALHIAMAKRVGAGLLTFDARMAQAARALGLEVLP